MTGAQPNGEAPFGGPVYEVGSRAKVVGEISIGLHGFQSGRRSTIAVFADERIYGPVFTKLSYARRQNDQICPVGQCHARTVKCLVAQPCAVKLMRIKIRDSLLYWRLQRLEVDFQSQRGGAVKALYVVADEEAAHCQPFVCRASDNGEYVDDGQMSQETIGGVIQNVAHGVLGAAHDALHPINSAQVMAAVYALPATRAHENILVVIGHAYHFMGHDLADGDNEIEAAACNEPVHLRRPGIAQLAFGLLKDELGRDFAQGLDVCTPVMHAEKLCGHGAKHSREL